MQLKIMLYTSINRSNLYSSKNVKQIIGAAVYKVHFCTMFFRSVCTVCARTVQPKLLSVSIFMHIKRSKLLFQNLKFQDM